MGSAVLSAASLLVFGLTASICSAETVPVFMWGDLEHKSQLANPLQRTTTSELEETLRAELKSDALLVAFVEETLSVEDLSHRDESGSYMPYLHRQLKHSIYLPSVETPVTAIADAAGGDLVRVRLTKKGLSRPLSEIPAGTSVLMIELADAQDEEPRAALLRRHDRFMSETVARLEDDRDVVAVYTARYPSWSLIEDDDEPSRFRRHLMQVDGAAEEVTPAPTAYSTQKVYNLTNMIVAFDSITVSTRGGAPVALKGEPTLVVNPEEHWIQLTVQDDSFNVTYTFTEESDGYWYMSKASVRNVSSTDSESFTTDSVYALSGFSYTCGSGVVMSSVNGTYTVALNNLQVQPFFEGTPLKFGDSFDCVGFFSAPIWSGIFVLTIIMSIFFYGITNMMDIRTMDRFDDPKGKTITINASE